MIVAVRDACPERSEAKSKGSSDLPGYMLTKGTQREQKGDKGVLPMKNALPNPYRQHPAQIRDREIEKRGITQPSFRVRSADAPLGEFRDFNFPGNI